VTICWQTSNKKAVDDYLFCFKKLRDYVDYFTINVSSPNTPDLRELQSKSNLDILLSQIQSENRKKNKIPVFVKIAPDINLNQIEDIIKVCENHEINGIIATNTTTSRDNIKNTKINLLGGGGISGRPISLKSNKVISHIRKLSKLKIIGVGGVFDINDYHNKINSGADLVQVYTGWIYEGPGMIKKINKAILEIE